MTPEEYLGKEVNEELRTIAKQLARERYALIHFGTPRKTPTITDAAKLLSYIREDNEEELAEDLTKLTQYYYVALCERNKEK